MRWVLCALLAFGLGHVSRAEAASSYCRTKTRVSGGYTRPVVGALVTVARSADPDTWVASTRTDVNGEWCISVWASSSYNITIGTETVYDVFIPADDLVLP